MNAATKGRPTLLASTETALTCLFRLGAQNGTYAEVGTVRRRHLLDRPTLTISEFGQLAPGPHAQAGTGLGLVITKRIVQALGGQVGVSSKKGGGSRFHAILPSSKQAGTPASAGLLSAAR